MAKKSSLTKLPDGTLQVNDGSNIIGKLIPDGDKYQVQMGEYGGFFSVRMNFNNALDLLIRNHLRVYTNRINSVKAGANLIFKRTLSK